MQEKDIYYEKQMTSIKHITNHQIQEQKTIIKQLQTEISE
jgi:hypothetical protein